MTVINYIQKPLDQKRRLLWIKIIHLCVVVTLVFVQPGWSPNELLGLKFVGLGTIIFSVAGRLWCSLYIGSRKNIELVSTGPYSICRNPLYLFSTLGSVGVGLFCGSIAIAVALGVIMSILFVVTARREAVFLRFKFGAVYHLFERSTPLFLPNPLLYRRGNDTTFCPRALETTFLDGMAFFAIIPVAAVVASLQAKQLIPMPLHIF